MSDLKHKSGFTLVELMMSIVILLIVLVYMTQAFTAQQKTYVVVDQVTEAQQNMRAVADLVERDIRRSGYMVPPHAAVCGFDATGGPDTLFVSNTDAIRTMFQLEGANEDLSGNYGAPVTGVTAAWSASGASFDLPLDRLWVDVPADGDDFVVGGGVIVVNRLEEDGKLACGVIRSITGTTLRVNFGSTSIGPVGLNADVVAVPANVYQLTPAAGNVPSMLRRNGVLLAKDVEDFQVTYYFDLDDDRVVDGGELFGDAGSAVADAFAEPAATFPDASLLREVQVNVVTVTRADDPNQEFNLGAGQVTGNRNAGSLPSGDGKRRRVSTARVRLRNAG
jgi:prepilin-type N-terminal cleavage/methylation domain-containing protein